MPLDSSNLRHGLAQDASVSEEESVSDTPIEQFAGAGWKELDEIAAKLGWRHSRLTAVLRYLRQKSPIFVVETKISRGVVKVRITKVAVDAKQAKQLSTDIISQLAKLYSNLKHTDRNREKLAYDVRTIAVRIAPFLENREFQIQYKRYKRQLGDLQLETQMEANAETPDSLDDPLRSQPNPKAATRRLGDSPPIFDRRALPRLVLIASIVIIGLLVSLFLTSTFLHAMEVLSIYVERINSQ